MIGATSLPALDAGALDRALASHGGEPTLLVQILRAAQEIDGWLPPATITYIAARLGLPRAQVEGVAGFYAFLHLAPVGRYHVLFSDNVTDRMAGQRGAARPALPQPVDRARQGVRGRSRLRGHHVLHRHVRPGSGAAGQRHRDPAPRRRARGHDRRPDPRPRCRSPTGRPSSSRSRTTCAAATSCSAPTCGPATRCAPRSRAGSATLELASNERSWRERVPMIAAGAQPRRSRKSSARTCAAAAAPASPPGLKWEACRTALGDAALRGLQRRRRRAGHVQGPRAARRSYADLVFEGMTVCALRRSARARASSTCAASTRTCCRTCEAVLARRRAAGPARQEHRGHSRASTSTSRSTSAPAPTSAARSRR